MDEHAFCRACAIIDIDATRRHLSATLGRCSRVRTRPSWTLPLP
jgi:hypothetical protein